MRVRFMLAGVVVGTAAGIAVSEIRRWWRSWGIDPDESRRILAGDDVVADPVASETRGITIDATPEQVWPWLVQMGFGRAGWYSYDRLDQRGQSADGLVEAWQSLKVGDIVPTHPGGGFEVVEIQPARSIVLRSDTALVKAQADAWAKQRAARADATATPADVTTTSTPGLAASGAILGQTPQQFSASWAFVIEPMSGGRSRLIERFRVWYGESGMASHVVMPVVGFGVFVMMQRQMVGIRGRAERLAVAQSRPTTTPAPTKAAAGEPRASAEPTPAAEPAPPARNGRDQGAEGPELATATVD